VVHKRRKLRKERSESCGKRSDEGRWDKCKWEQGLVMAVSQG